MKIGKYRITTKEKQAAEPIDNKEVIKIQEMGIRVWGKEGTNDYMQLILIVMCETEYGKKK